MLGNHEARRVESRARLRVVPWRVFLVVVAVVTVGAAGALALAPDHDREPGAVSNEASVETTTTPSPPRVLVIGDSNLEYASTNVQAALTSIGADAVTHGKAGYGLKDLDSYWLPQLPGLLAVSDPEIVVVLLGTNDTSVVNAAAFPGRLDRLMAALGDRRVVWVTHTEIRPGQQGVGAKAVNSAIRAATVRWANLVVLDLAPLEVYTDGLFGDDLVHFSVPGRDVLAAEVAAVSDQVASVPLAVPVPVTVPVTIPPVAGLP